MSIQKQLIKETEDFVRAFLEGEGSGHDWWHIERVRNMALFIHKKEEKGDPFIIELAALLHDIGDRKLHKDEEFGRKLLLEIIDKLQITESEKAHIFEIIESLSFKGAEVRTDMRTIEGKIVQDADRLDAIGAIGIARAFAYGGSKKRLIYDPQDKPILHKNYDQYKNSNGSSINHFYEKLLLLKDRLNTETAKEIAKERHEFMEKYLKQFFSEWNMSS